MVIVECSSRPGSTAQWSIHGPVKKKSNLNSRFKSLNVLPEIRIEIRIQD